MFSGNCPSGKLIKNVNHLQLNRVCLFPCLLSRFGSLIEVHLVSGRKVGYMKYADKQVIL